MAPVHEIIAGAVNLKALMLARRDDLGDCHLTAPLALAVHFSPKGGCTEVIVKHIRRARHEVLLQAYSFTSKPIAEALVDAKTRGLNVDIVLDRANETVGNDPDWTIDDDVATNCESLAVVARLVANICRALDGSARDQRTEPAS